MDPKQYDLGKEEELVRLNREVLGYLKACHDEHHGTDFKGRQYAIEALSKLVEDSHLYESIGCVCGVCGLVEAGYPPPRWELSNPGVDGDQHWLCPECQAV